MRIVEAQVIPLTQINGIEIIKHLENIARTCYKSHDKTTDDEQSALRLLRNLKNAGHDSMFEHYTISMRYITNIAAYKDLTRMRKASFAIESTRWCSYNKDKFGKELTFIRPVEIPKDSLKYQIWLNAMEQAEKNYMDMAKLGATADELSLMLPQSTAAEVNITTNLRHWNHIFGLRAVGHSRPCVKQIMQPTLEMFHKEIPIVFDDVYNKMVAEKQKQR